MASQLSLGLPEPTSSPCAPLGVPGHESSLDTVHRGVCALKGRKVLILKGLQRFPKCGMITVGRFSV